MLETDRYADVVQIEQVQTKRANELLSHGWRLLAIVPTSNWSTAKGNDRGGYVHRSCFYVVGRPEGVAALEERVEG